MKKITLFFTVLFLFVFSWQGMSQVTIGAATDGSGINSSPITPYYGYSYSQTIYLASEISASGDISSLEFPLNAGTDISSCDETVDVWIGHTVKTSFDTTSDWVDVTTLTQVLTSGTITSAGDMATITFSAPFTYNGTDNLIIAVDANESGYGSSSDYFYNSPSVGNLTLIHRNDNVNTDPTSPATGALKSWRGNVTLVGITQSCPAPTDLATSNITVAGVDLAWVDNASASAWEYVVQAVGTGEPTAAGTAATAVTETVTGLMSETDYEVYVRADCGAGDFSSWVGPVNFTTLISCPAPTDLATSNITTTGVDLAWIDNASASAWEYVVQAAGTGEPTAAGTAASAVTETVTGLTTATNYEVYVRADCGAGDFSSWVGPINFTTACDVYTPDYTEDFTTFVPTCWEEADSGDPTTGPTDLGSGSWLAEEFAHGSTSGGGAVNINLYDLGKSDWILSPNFDLSAGGYELKLDVALTSYNSTAADVMGSDDEVQLLYTEDGTTWNNLMTWNVANQPATAGETITVTLTSTGTNVQFGIWASEGAVDDLEDYDFHVDNFVIRAIPACLEPTDLVVSNVTTTGIDLAWTDNASASAWEYVVQAAGTGEPTVAGTAVTAVTETVTGLMEETAYEVYVRTDCGAGNFSAWVGPVDFFTGYCQPEVTSSALTYVDTFNTINGVTNIANASTGFSTDNYGNYFDTMSVSLAATRTFDFSAEIVGGTAGCAVWVDWNNDLVFDVATETVFQNGGYGAGPFTGTITVPAGTADGDYRMRIMIDFSDSLIDDDACTFNGTRGEVEDYKIIVDATLLPSCLEPTDLATSNVTATGVDLAWVDNASASAWEYVVQAVGTGEPTAAGTAASAVTETVTGLMSETDYEVYVRADCGAGDFSSWVGPVNFTTLISCLAPTDLAISNITMTGVDLAWTDNASASAWEYVVQAVGTGEPVAAGTQVAAVTETVTGLTAGTAYEVYVRTDCGAGDFSVWVGPLNFATECVVMTIPWSENFDSMTSVGDGIIPNCMLEIGDWVSYDAPASHERKPNSGSNYIATNWGADDWLFLPTMHLEANQEYNFKFSYVSDTAGFTIETKYGTGKTEADMTTTIGDGLTDPTNTDYQQYVAAFTPTVAGDYNIGVHVTAGFSPWYLSMDDFEVVASTAAIENATIEGFNMYPNPVTNTLNLTAQSSIDSVHIYNMLGQEVLQNTVNALDAQIDMHSLSSGAYIVKVNSGNNVGTYKLIKK